MQPCTVEIFDRCQLISAFTADFSCFPAVFSLFQLLSADSARPVRLQGQLLQAATTDWIWFCFLRHFSLRICMF